MFHLKLLVALIVSNLEQSSAQSFNECVPPTAQDVFVQQCPTEKKSDVTSQLISKSNEVLILEEFCDEEQPDRCYAVYDQVSMKNDRPVVYRCLKNNNTQEELWRTPLAQGQTIDTFLWQVDNQSLPEDHYFKSMEDALFSSGAVVQDTNETKKVLLIGYNWLVASKYFLKYYPTFNVSIVEPLAKLVTIAREWFGFRKESGYEIISKSGVEFIRGTNRQFDIVLISDHSSDRKAEFISPSADYFDSNVIGTLANIIPDDGVLLINVVLGNHGNKEEQLEKMRIWYTEFFEFVEFECSTKHVAIMTCRHSPIENVRATGPKRSSNEKVEEESNGDIPLEELSLMREMYLEFE